MQEQSDKSFQSDKIIFYLKIQGDLYFGKYKLVNIKHTI